MRKKKEAANGKPVLYTLTPEELRDAQTRHDALKVLHERLREAQAVALIGQEGHDHFMRKLAEDHDLPSRYELNIETGECTEWVDG